MKDLKLYGHVKKFCQDGIEFAKKRLELLGDKAPKRISEKFLVVDDNTISNQQMVVTDWFTLIVRSEGDLQKLQSFQGAAKYLNNHVTISKQLNTLVGTYSFMRRLETNELLRTILGALLIEVDRPAFNEKSFDEVYGRMEKWLFAEKLKYKYFAPISNFDMEQDRLELAPNFAIIKISKEEKEELMSTSDSFHSTIPILSFKKFAFEFIAEQPKLIGEAPNESPEKIQPTVEARLLFTEASSALRLFKTGLIGFNHIWDIDIIWNFQGTSNSFSHIGPTDYYGDHMTLTTKEIPQFLELWDRYKKISQKKRRKILNAVSRLNFGTERVRAEDKLVDYFVGFESLFLNDDNPELKYRLALYVAHWLGATVDERKKIYKLIAKGYDQRSTIVHGGKPEQTIKIDGGVTSLSELTKLTEEYLRSAIKKFIVECADNNQTEAKLIEELRERILE